MMPPVKPVRPASLSPCTFLQQSSAADDPTLLQPHAAASVDSVWQGRQGGRYVVLNQVPTSYLSSKQSSRQSDKQPDRQTGRVGRIKRSRGTASEKEGEKEKD
ncbi:hypothetical protein IF1G_03666 [Cordyceps javanica]|uniref:Uncharacterized protein n=1 Tax=Cordyceps javanica TaxID=43265 RepID=A0A545V881_9HYPO|nr:hypothetical protein IF1G_03666 [Cordyceps javanica]